MAKLKASYALQSIIMINYHDDVHDQDLSAHLLQGKVEGLPYAGLCHIVRVFQFHSDSFDSLSLCA